MAAMKRDILVKSNLGDDVLLFRRMHGTEHMSRPYEYRVELLTQQEDIALHEVIGQQMTIHLSIGKDKFRYFSGVVARFAYVGTEGDYHRYDAVLRPWFWNLTRRSDCRIFQELTVPDIIKEVFRDAGFSEFEESLSGEYRTWKYRVQYRETDFDFVSRLMEQEGIYYFFKHEDGKDTLVLADSINAHAPFENFDEVRFFPQGADGTLEEPGIFEWQVAHEYQPTIFAHTDYDFIEPTKDLSAKAQIPRDHTKADSEIYDYPGAYYDPAEGDTYAKVRVEELQSQYERCTGEGNVPGIAVGHLFNLARHPRGDQNREYLVLGCDHIIDGGDYESKGAGSPPQYKVSFTVLSSAEKYRAPRVTPKPIVQGPQTAVIVGPDGEQVWCDEYGRVKVQFHWDREGGQDENSSCWVRVSQSAAGSTWGGMFIPHIGQEVVVDFLEGDPDRPLITGRVYNHDQMPPEALPDNKYKSILRDHYGNELIFDGTPGDENILLRSPHHESGVVLGRSMHTFSESNMHEFTAGDKHEGSIGITTEWMIGVSAEASLAVKYDLSVASTTEYALGLGKSYSWGPKLSLSNDDEIELSSGDFKQQVEKEIVLDSEEATYLVGGKQFNSQVRVEGKEVDGKAKPGQLVLSYNETGHTRTEFVGDLKMLKRLWRSSLLLGAAGTVAGAFAIDLGQEGKKGWRDGLSITSAVLFTAMLATDVAIWKKISNFQKDPPPHEDEPEAKIVLNKDGVALTAGKKRDSFIVLQEGGKVFIYGDGDMHIGSKGKLTLESEKEVKIMTPKFTPNTPAKNDAIDVKAKPKKPKPLPVPKKNREAKRRQAQWFTASATVGKPKR